MNTQNPDHRLQIEIVKNFNVAPEEVFDAWLDPGMLSRWMFGPEVREEEIVSLQNNPEKGGTFSFVVLRDGEEIDHRGTYREINRPQRLVFTWGVDTEAGDESVVFISIEATADGCRLTLVHKMDPKWEEYKERTKEGWTYMLSKLKEIL